MVHDICCHIASKHTNNSQIKQDVCLNDFLFQAQNIDMSCPLSKFIYIYKDKISEEVFFVRSDTNNGSIFIELKSRPKV